MKIRIEYDSGEIRNFVCHSINPNDVFTIETEDPVFGNEHFKCKATPKPPVKRNFTWPQNPTKFYTEKNHE